MEGSDRINDGASSKFAGNKRGTPNKRWKPEYDNFLIPLLVEQVRKGLKCDKSFKRTAFAFAAVSVNSRFKTDFSTDNVENHYRTIKARYAEIKKAKDLSGAGWDDATKTITLDPLVALSYIEAHPAARLYINKPIENYEGLRIICGDDNATGSYATSLFSEFGERSEDDDTNNDIGESPQTEQRSDEDRDTNPAPPISTSPATSSMNRSQSASRLTKGPSGMTELITAVGAMASALKNPTHWTENLYEKVMEVDGFAEHELVVVFDYLQLHEIQARGFIVKKMALRRLWIEKFLSQVE